MSSISLQSSTHYKCIATQIDTTDDLARAKAMFTSDPHPLHMSIGWHSHSCDTCTEWACITPNTAYVIYFK